MRISWNILAATALALGIAQCRKEQPVVWPDVSALDVLAEKSEGAVERKDIKAMRALLPELRPAGARVVAGKLPANAANAAAVAELVGDLKDLMTKLDKPESLSDGDLQALLAGVHPIVDQLMQKSGMPHVHEAPRP